MMRIPHLDIKVAPLGVGKGKWRKWDRSLSWIMQITRTSSVSGGEFAGTTPAELAKEVSADMVVHLIDTAAKNGTPVGRATWYRCAMSFLELWWQHISRRHQTELPSMGCQRTGKCCRKGVPRVSLFEQEAIASYISQLPMEEKVAITADIAEAANAHYEDPVLGTGVPCPLLGVGPDGRARCRVHEVRPVACRVAAITTPTSWDCPLWQVQKGSFPVLDPALVRPYLNLFAWARTIFAETVLRDYELRQMVLLPFGLLRFLGFNDLIPPCEEQPLVRAAIAHTHGYADALYLRAMEPPPEGWVEDNAEEVKPETLPRFHPPTTE